MTKRCVTCGVVVILILLVAFLMAWHKYALDEADRQATIRLLSSFHKDYLHSVGLDRQDYLEKLKKYNKEHSGILDEYVKRMELGEE